MLSELNDVQHISTITHEGKVLVFATTGDGRVWYIVRKDGFEQTNSRLESWEDAKELFFPGADDPSDASMVGGKAVADESVLELERQTLTYQDNHGKTRYYSRSLYDTHRLTGTAPVRIVSGMGYLYVFRQAKLAKNIYVDRFVLDGMTNTLVRKLEVRYKRSKKKHEPSAPPQDGENLYSYDWDSLDFRATDGKNFYEPTTELSIIEDVQEGWFSVVLLPTGDHDRYRWHIFSYNSRLSVVELTSIAASQDGLFEFKDGDAPGIIRQVLAMRDESETDLEVNGAPAAVKYDVQVETQDKAGEKMLLRQATRVMLAVPVERFIIRGGRLVTERAAAVIDFAAALDGTLSYPVVQEPFKKVLRADVQDVLLPLDSLEKVKAVGGRSAAEGDIGGLRQARGGRVEMSAISTAGGVSPDMLAIRKLQARIEETRSYDGIYTAQPVVIGELQTTLAGGEEGEEQVDRLVLSSPLEEELSVGTRLVIRDGRHGFPWPFVVAEDTTTGVHSIAVEPDDYRGPLGAQVILADAFMLETPERHDLGSFRIQPADGESAYFDGAITGVRRDLDGRLRVYALNHGLQDGDPLMITNTRNYNGVYPVRVEGENSFVIDVPWQVGQAVNLRLETLRRRALILDGRTAFIEIPHRPYLNAAQFTLEAWVKIHDQQPSGKNDHIILGKWAGESTYPWLVRYWRNTGKISAARRGKTSGQVQISSTRPLNDGLAHHIALVADGKTLSLYLDGELDASAPDKTAQAENTAPVSIGGRPNARSNYFLGGEVSDVRLWGRPCSQDEIKSHMYTRLLGAEEGLLGSWQLGSLVGGEQRTALDLSRHGNHGRAHGTLFAGGVGLPARQFDDRPVTAYLNEDTFAVTQGATYRESFDFIPHFNRDLSAQMDDAAAMLSAIGADDKPIFTFAYKGKRSRDDEGWRVLTSRPYGASPDPSVSGYPESATNRFEYLGNGIFRAHGEFTVPEGVSLMRTFGLDNVRGKDFQGLGVTNHRIQMVSEAVTLARSIQHIRLVHLAQAGPELAEDLDEIASLEGQEAAYVKELRRLNDRRNALNNAQSTYTRYTTAEERVRTLQAEMDQAKRTYDGELNNPLNYYCKIRNAHSGGYLVRGDAFPNYVEAFKDINVAYRLWYFEVSGSAYLVRNKKLTDGGQPGYMERARFIKEWVLVNETGRDDGRNGKLWQFQRTGGAYFIKNQEAAGEGLGSVLGVYESYRVRMLETSVSSSKSELKWTLEPDRSLGAYNQKAIDDARRAWESSRSRLSSAQAEQARFADLLPDEVREAIRQNKSASQLKRLINARLAEVDQDIKAAVSALKKVRTSLGGKRTAWNQAYGRLRASTRAGSPYAMPALPGNSRGLATRGALLGFVKPDGPLHLSATGDGYVQLDYIDSTGRMRQARYDAVADSHNSTFEEWLPEGWRRCLSLGGSRAMVKLEKMIPLESEWTIEAWFYYPAASPDGLVDPDDLRWESGSHLTHGDRFDAHIAVKGWQLGSRISRGYNFLDSGFDMRQLTPGWHHLAAVGLGHEETATTRFYIDGEFVGDVKEHALSRAASDQVRENVRKTRMRSDNAITVVGNHQYGSAPFWRIAELRIWGLALGEEEIEVNSKTLLSGDEPGLLAYFPFDGDARDHGPRKSYHGTLRDADFIPCTARIGRPNQAVMGFNGLTDYLVMQESFKITPKGTLEAWVRFDHWEDQVLFQAGPNFQVELMNRELRFLLGGRGTSRIEDVDISIPADMGWHHIAVTWEYSDRMSLRVYVDGRYDIDRYGSGGKVTPPVVESLKAGLSRQSARASFRGQMAEIRLWKIRRKSKDFKATWNRRLVGDEPGLVGYWPLDCIELSQTSWGSALRYTPGRHEGGQGLRLYGEGMQMVGDTALPVAPASGSALVSTEYITYGANRSAMLRRFLALPQWGGVSLLGHKRIEELELKWVGNVQMKPTLLGYIEGAPPVPSENLTIDPPSYQEASSITLNMSEEVKYSWRREQEVGGGADISLFLGAGGLDDNKSGFRGDLSFSFKELRQSEVSSSVTTVMKNSLELRGHPEEEPKFPHLGRRFIPKNVGYALVVSALGDLFIVRLKRSRRMLSYNVQPVEDLPLDFNTITFMINPAYTMNGSLDGMTGSAATSERFFKDVPRMRAQYGSYYPASYYRLQEAYQLKHKIDQADKQREQFFANYDAVLIDETSLNRQVGDVEAADTGRVSGLLDEIKSESERQEKVTTSTIKLAEWQQKMENLRVQAGKRNLVDTYVWDADGGLYAESQEIVDTLEHTIGGSFTMDIGLGYEGEFDVAIQWELTALATLNLTQTMTKTVERSQALSLEVDLAGVERLGVTDYKDRPYQPGEKVDRYRFMTFFLEGSTANFDDFFSQVVDPEWLAGNDEEARALRQVDRTRKNKAWRVLHRVTYVERPALMNFGQDTRQLMRSEEQPHFFTEFGPLQESVMDLHSAHAEHRTDLEEDLQNVHESLEALQEENDVLKEKLDELLDLLRNGRGPSS